MKTYYFTFGFGHTIPTNLVGEGNSLGNHYFKIESENYGSARLEMDSIFKSKWAFQYSEKEFEGQVEKYGLKEFKAIPISQTNSPDEIL